MSIVIGDLDVANELLNNEFRVSTLEKVLQTIIDNNKTLILPTQQDLENIRVQTAEQLKKKYPNNGIEYKKQP